ncbi:VPLPA-CTERM sorting domain-containing protein [Roseovarius sp. ZX-A-9]|uniref:VPLPA-CTERM sorting domain-containing protein n=1 Tax=Roseovarius sp. ZX-A-9 TaxID=3014783 RepID=UPI0023304392|nr:VPLPA-CTERM sorting domain-containing protein [Roseovarius sp. ZX-A-9]
MFNRVTSAAAIATLIAFGASSAFAASIYQVTVTGTLQQTVTTDDGNLTLTSNDVFASAFGNSFEMTWSAPLDTELDPSNAWIAGDISAVYNGNLISPERPGARGLLTKRQIDTGRSVTISANLPSDAFGSDAPDFDGGLQLTAIWGDNDPYDVSYRLPLDLGGDVYETQYISFLGIANVRRCGPRYCYTTRQGYNAFASIDNVVVSPQVSAVPLPASALFLGASLVGFGLLRRRKEAA